MFGPKSPRLAFGLAVLLLAMSVFPTAAYADAPYTVQPGDTLSNIAFRFSTSVDAIAEANGINDYSLIFVGETLTIPGATPSASNPAPQPAIQRVTTAPPGSASSVLGNYRLLTYYGHPNDDRMGILGELSKQGLVNELRRVAALYQAHSDRPVIPAIHFIATVAQEGPGADGKYRAWTTRSLVEEYSDLAAANGMLMILDLQFGHSVVQDELEPWIPLLSQPHVHLAIDPEFDMWPGQLPGEHIGHTNPDEINYAQAVLSDLVQKYNLPDKILILHQFAPNMLPNKGAIQQFPNVQIVTVMDGWGGQALKRKHYDWYVRDELIEYAGIKLFYRQDSPLFTPGEIMDLDPIPDVIVYQ